MVPHIRFSDFLRSSLKVENACWGSPQTPVLKTKERKIEMVERLRNKEIKLRVTEEELQLIQLKMEQAHMKNREAYLRKMAIDGMVIYSDNEATKALSYEISQIGNNINQITKRVNTNDGTMMEDIQQIKEMMREVWQLQRYGLSQRRLIKP